MLKRRYLIEYWRYEPETLPEHCTHQRGRRQRVVLCVAARVASVQPKKGVRVIEPLRASLLQVCVI